MFFQVIRHEDYLPSIRHALGISRSTQFCYPLLELQMYQTNVWFRNGSFQTLMNTIIEKRNVDRIFAHQDDIIVANNSFEEMIQKSYFLFNVIRQHNLTLCAAKSNFHQKNIKYLDFQISENKVFLIESNIAKIISFPRITSKKVLKSFLATIGYYRHLILAYAEITSLLIALTSPKVKLSWLPEYELAFNQIHNIF